MLSLSQILEHLHHYNLFIFFSGSAYVGIGKVARFGPLVAMIEAGVKLPPLFISLSWPSSFGGIPKKLVLTPV